MKNTFKRSFIVTTFLLALLPMVKVHADELNLSISALISIDEKRVNFIISNGETFDIKCDFISIKAEYINNETQKEVGFREVQLKDLIIKKGQIDFQVEAGQEILEFFMERIYSSVSISHLQSSSLKSKCYRPAPTPAGNKQFLSAVKEGDLPRVISLYEQGADLNSKDNDGMTPLHWAAWMGYLEVVKYLVDQGAEVDTKDNTGMTPLHWAAERSRLEVVKYLVDQGADLNSRDNKGYTPLHWAARNGYLEVVKYLVDQGADYNSKDNDGYTPLHSSASNNRLEIVKYLVDQGADLNSKNKSGLTPLWAAVFWGRFEVAAYLKAHGGHE